MQSHVFEARRLHSRTLMLPIIEVRFREQARDHSLENAVQRWVARLEGMRFDVHGADAVIERSGRRDTSIRLTVTLGDGASSAVACTHAEPFVAVSEAFRSVRRALLLARSAADRRSSSAA